MTTRLDYQYRPTMRHRLDVLTVTYNNPCVRPARASASCNDFAFLILCCRRRTCARCWPSRKWAMMWRWECTGPGKRMVPRLREFFRQGQAAVVSNSKNKILATWEPFFCRALYSARKNGYVDKHVFKTYVAEGQSSF